MSALVAQVQGLTDKQLRAFAKKIGGRTGLGGQGASDNALSPQDRKKLVILALCQQLYLRRFEMPHAAHGDPGMCLECRCDHQVPWSAQLHYVGFFVLVVSLFFNLLESALKRVVLAIVLSSWLSSCVHVVSYSITPHHHTQTAGTRQASSWR
jgi:hypothetical protein